MSRHLTLDSRAALDPDVERGREWFPSSIDACRSEASTRTRLCEEGSIFVEEMSYDG
jgi:hypothetical protein